MHEKVMHDKVMMVVVAWLLVGVSAVSAQETVDVLGCPAVGIEMDCLVLKARENVIYDISTAKPRPRAGYLAVHLTGTKSHKLGICQQGAILENIHWTYTNERCH
jgi:hypothetical protein